MIELFILDFLQLLSLEINRCCSWRIKMIFRNNDLISYLWKRKIRRGLFWNWRLRRHFSLIELIVLVLLLIRYNLSDLFLTSYRGWLLLSVLKSLIWKDSSFYWLKYRALYFKVKLSQTYIYFIIVDPSLEEMG